MLKFFNIASNFNHDNLDYTKILHYVDHMQKSYYPLETFRISNHELNIETGRCDKISRCYRISLLFSLFTFYLIAQNIDQFDIICLIK